MRLNAAQERVMLAAQKGYEAYSRYTGGKSAVTGDPLPQWAALPGQVTNAWFAAASAIIEAIQPVGHDG